VTPTTQMVRDERTEFAAFLRGLAPEQIVALIESYTELNGLTGGFDRRAGQAQARRTLLN
jgi:hypothetical protein